MLAGGAHPKTQLIGVSTGIAFATYTSVGTVGNTGHLAYGATSFHTPRAAEDEQGNGARLNREEARAARTV